MIFAPQAPTVARNVPGKLHAENEITLSPKRCLAQQDEDPSSQLGLKRRHVRPDPQPARRVPLDPLSPSDLENRRVRRSQSAYALSHLSLVLPSFSPDLRVSYPEQPSSSGPWGMRTSEDPVCSWPPPIDPRGSSHSATSHRRPLHTIDENQSSRAAQAVLRTRDMLQPSRSRTMSLTSHRPSEDLWHGLEPIDAANLQLYPTPPGLPPPSEQRRISSDSDSLLCGSVSLSLALGSQPLKASEPTKAVPPIGAERSRVVSMTPFKSPATTVPNDRPSSRLKTRLQNDMPLSGTASTGYTVVPREDLERLRRQAVWNKYTPKILSPLNPLRASTSGFDLSGDPACQLRISSQSLSNYPSPRYSKYLPRRARTICDVHQSFDWDTTCIHCQECKRDSVCKKLLALHYRQCRSLQVQRGKPPLVIPQCGANPSVVADDDRLALASRIREAFAYDMDDEEKSLWEEVAAVTGVAPPSFSRTCAAAHLRAHDADDVHEDYVDTDEGLRTSVSGALFHSVSVY